jgi:hypothetical protein
VGTLLAMIPPGLLGPDSYGSQDMPQQRLAETPAPAQAEEEAVILPPSF